MKTYREHYNKCREAYGISTVSVYDLSIAFNFLQFDVDNFNIMSKRIKECFESGLGCHEDKWAIRLNDWEHILEIENFCQEVMPQIEQSIFGSYLKVEFVHPYKNKCGSTLESSWAWHYDDCPKEFIKLAVYLNDVNEDNGCMQIIASANNNVPVIATYRLDPSAIKGFPPPVFPRTRVPSDVLERIQENGGKFVNLTGSSGTHFVFTPNVMHRGTIPSDSQNSREAVFFFLRPSLKKHKKYTANAHSFLPEKNVKKYKLD
mgnify:CR=1 FL=1|tara:strand:- start:375 stop:1157 length:783 start_codon:yes stop_codon:yes gene_type:complete